MPDTIVVDEINVNIASLDPRGALPDQYSGSGTFGLLPNERGTVGIEPRGDATISQAEQLSAIGQINITTEPTGHINVPIVKVVDPAVGRESFRIIIVNRDGSVVAELADYIFETLVWDLNQPGAASFTCRVDDAISQVKVLTTEVQYWLGNRLLAWHVITGQDGDEKTARFQSNDLLWYFTKRVFGRASRYNYVRNHSFESMDSGWSIARYSPTEPNSTIADHQYGYSILDRNSFTGTRSLRLFQPYPDDQTGLITVGSDVPPSSSPGAPPTHSVKNSGKTNGYQEVGKDMLKYGYAATSNFMWVTPPANVYESVDPEGQKWQVSAWCYIEPDMFAPKDGIALQVARFSATETEMLGPEDDPSDRRPFPKLIEKAVVSIDNTTPTGVWTRLTAELEQPHVSVEFMQVALFAGYGRGIVFDEVTLTKDDGLFFYNQEQTQIFSAIISHAQDVNYGKSDLGIKVNGKTVYEDQRSTNIFRTEKYDFSEHQVIMDAINQYPSFYQGFDIAVRCTPNTAAPTDPSTATRSINTFFPFKGKHRNDIRLEFGKNIATYGYSVSGEGTENSVVVLGDGDGSGREEGGYSDPAALDGLVLESVYNAFPGSLMRTLLDQARKGVERYKKRMAFPKLTTYSTAFDDLLYSGLTEGDCVQVSVHHGNVDLEGWYRINRITLNPSDRTLSFDVGEDITPYLVP